MLRETKQHATDLNPAVVVDTEIHHKTARENISLGASE
jgi:hypothetical protein